VTVKLVGLREGERQTERDRETARAGDRGSGG
jgi:hypothetical protein